jgi:hypothetical protein
VEKLKDKEKSKDREENMNLSEQYEDHRYLLNEKSVESNCIAKIHSVKR